MFLLSLSRLIKFSIQNFFRNFWLSVVTITIIILTLFSVTSLVFVNAVMSESIALVKSKVDVSIYFKPTATEPQVKAVQDDLASLDYVEEVQYVAKAQALQRLRDQYQDRPILLESLKELEQNPLGDTLIVSTHETEDYQKVIDVLNVTPEYAAIIENKSFEDNKEIIERLETLSDQVTRAGWGITVFFAVISVLVIVNTIRIAIYSHRDEIGIMKLVGASNWFVRGPFLGEAILYAVAGTAATLALTLALVNVSDPYISGLLGQSTFSLSGHLYENMVQIFGLELLGMVVVSMFSTSIALSRYLKV